jgi:hypothetical protein
MRKQRIKNMLKKIQIASQVASILKDEEKPRMRAYPYIESRYTVRYAKFYSS